MTTEQAKPMQASEAHLEGDGTKANSSQAAGAFHQFNAFIRDTGDRPQQRRRMAHFGWITALFVIPVGIFAVVAVQTDHFADTTAEAIRKTKESGDAAAIAKHEQDAAATETVNKWLEDQRKGASGRFHWVEGTVEPARLFAVRSWEIVDVYTWLPDASRKSINKNTYSEDILRQGGGIVTVRVDSSNKGGTPITTLWKVYLLDAVLPKKVIWSIREN